jgi:hypothetical protein
MKQDNFKTPVLFKRFQGSILALFPDELYNEDLYGNSQIMSYQIIGQHGAANVELITECENATPEEYEDIKNELTRLGYNLIITQ